MESYSQIGMRQEQPGIYIPVFSPLNGTMMSLRGPPDAWATGMTPAAWDKDRMRTVVRHRKENAANHELDDVYAKMFINHRTEADAGFREPIQDK